MENYISIPATINKSNPGEMDADGNYVFEVEASNENVDLQNQNILQTALKDSEEYFLSNGVISDDHQHRTRDEEGNVATNYDKVIGEPISVRREGKRTFVKGKLYGAVNAAKPFINLLKSASSRVKASVGGIMPTIINNPDGTETITSFMWNDLALTCTPVNSTVAPACFAKSMSIDEFCKALTVAPTNTNSALKTGGDAMIKEDLEGKKTDIKNLNDDEDDEKKTEEKSEEKVEKSCLEMNEPSEKIKAALQESMGKADELNDLIQDVKNCILSGFLEGKDDAISYMVDNGCSIEVANNIYENLTREEDMMKFTEKMNEIFKSFGKKDCDEVEKCDKVNKSESAEEDKNDKELTLFDEEDIDLDEEDDDESDDEEKVEKSKDVKKSFGDDEAYSEDYCDITNILKSFDERIEAKDAQIAELQKSLIQMGEYITSALAEPMVKKSVMVETKNNAASGYVKPTQEDLETVKVVLCNAKRDGAIDLRKSVHLETAFQQELNYGKRMSEADRHEILSLYKKYN